MKNKIQKSSNPWAMRVLKNAFYLYYVWCWDYDKCDEIYECLISTKLWWFNFDLIKWEFSYCRLRLYWIIFNHFDYLHFYWQSLKFTQKQFTFNIHSPYTFDLLIVQKIMFFLSSLHLYFFFLKCKIIASQFMKKKKAIKNPPMRKIIQDLEELMWAICNLNYHKTSLPISNLSLRHFKLKWFCLLLFEKSTCWFLSLSLFYFPINAFKDSSDISEYILSSA